LDIVDVNGPYPAVWVFDWPRDTLTRLTFGSAPSLKPVWTPDGRRIAFSSPRDGGVANLYWQPSDGSADVQRLTESRHTQMPSSWHPNGKLLAFTETNLGQTGQDLMLLPLDGNETSGWKPGKPYAFLNQSFDEVDLQFSPDGRWVAYFSNESGRAEVYVRPFPNAVGKWPISSGGGSYPLWSRTRHEIFFRSPDQQLMVASYSVNGDIFRAEKPRPWSSRRFLGRPRLAAYDLHPDGNRFALAPAPDAQSVKQDKVVFVFNFFDELRRIAPTKP